MARAVTSLAAAQSLTKFTSASTRPVAKANIVPLDPFAVADAAQYDAAVTLVGVDVILGDR